MQRFGSIFMVIGLAACLAVIACSLFAQEDNARLPLDRLLQLHKDGNYKEAYEGLRRHVLSKDTASAELPNALQTAISCLQQLNRTDEIDAFREQAVAAHPDDWRLLAAAARSYLEVDHYGFLIAGEYHRGPHRGGASAVDAAARDRVRAMQLYLRAMKAAQSADNKQEPAQMLFGFAQAISYGDASQAWRLQSLTDLETLPDYDERWGYQGGASQGAPVDEKGEPVFYAVPKNWEAARNDGERWRWVLETMVEWHPARRNDERAIRAQFLQSQFDVHTMAEYRALLARQVDESDNDENHDRPATWSLETLGEDETIARLATGIKRFKLPDEHNFIKLYQQVIENSVSADGADALDALRNLAEIFQNRRQYPRAAEYLRLAVERTSGDVRAHYQERLDQIVGNWGEFEGVSMQPAGRGASVEFRFRNAHRVEFVAHAIDIRKLLDNVKAYLKSNPKQLDWQRTNISEIGYLLVQENQKQYVGAEVAKWSLDLEPREKHFDKRITVTTPLQKSGAYLVTANVADGNTCQIVLWVADMALVRKPMVEKSFYFVADAASGAPIEGANVEFFGFRQRHVGGNRYEVDTKITTTKTDKNGQAFLPIPEEAQDAAERGFQWIATATTPAGRLAYLGFHNVWRAQYYDAEYKEEKTFAITDRPVYRPGQRVEFKFWIRLAQYDLDDKSVFAHQTFAVEIHDPKGEKVYTKTLTSDVYGGIADHFDLPADATLGPYQVVVVNHGGGTFRVEEYKKPEFEVTVETPPLSPPQVGEGKGEGPVMLGEKVSATIRARYYFGSPVTSATVKYKVLRSEHAAQWYPPRPWDWLYGAGYWWFASDYEWYPGWRDWGCRRPAPSWFWHPTPPPEVVAEREVSIGPDGTVQVEIDTAIAKAAHPDQDHRYTIEAEVVDQSRRTIVGRGEVLVARKPFEVYAWVDRGYYRVGDTIDASFAARRVDGRPVAGDGHLRLLKINYDQAPDRKPVEVEVRNWKLATDADGGAEIQLKASEKGQYRLSYRVTDKAGHEIEGGYLFTIVGEGFDGHEFRFNELELVPDQRDYAPGDTVHLQVNANRAGATVLLFVRPANGAYLPPQMLRLAGKSTVVDVGVTQKDMPNFFVEAITIAGGNVHTQVREIHVPPVKRILNVELVPSAHEFKPDERAKVTLKLSDEAAHT